MPRRAHPIWILSALALAALGAPHGDARAQSGPPPSGEPAAIAPLRHREDVIGVRLAPGLARSLARDTRSGPIGIDAVDALARDLGGVRFEAEFPATAGALADFWIAHLPAGLDARAAASRFEALAEVRQTWPIAILPAAATPNDSLWSAAYYFYQPSRRDIGAPEAWDVTTGDTAIVVAIIDTGVYTDHPDLAGQIWINRAERDGAPGIDDDGNGYVDDVHGWDFVDLPAGADVRPGEDGRVPDNDPNDFAGHGTAVAGLVGARTNNGIGVAGTVWKARMIPLRIGWSSSAHPSGEGDVSYMARAVDYATRMGASVINCSFTTTNQPDLIAAADAAIAAGVTVVTAAGNFAVTHYLAQREDVISVTGVGPDDKVLGYVTVGPTVDLAAAGSRLTTTTLDRDTLGNRWADYTNGASGTSFSSPLVAGSVALLQADRRARGLSPLTPFEVRLRLLDTADDIALLNAGSGGFGTGRLNLRRALTDPPASRRAETRVRPTGPMAALPSPSGRSLLALVAGSSVTVLDVQTGGTLRSIALPARASGGISAARLGLSAGIGLFVVADGAIHGFDADLDPLPGWPVAVPVHADARTREVVLADLDGDDAVEVLWCGGRDGRVHVFSADGRPFVEPLRVDTPGRDIVIAVSDLDGAPGLEIVVATTDSTTVRRPDGSMLPGWPVRNGSDPPAALIARLAPAEPPSVIFGHQTITAMTSGAIRWQFPDAQSPPAGTASQPPIAADLDGDGAAEIVQIRSHPMPIAVLGPTGDPLPGWQSPVLTQNFEAPPVVGPVGPGGRMGILLSEPVQGLRAFDASGVNLRTFPKPGLAGREPFIGDIDGDGQTEVVAGAYPNDDLMFYDSGPGSWPASPRGWLTARANVARTGSLTYAPPLVAPSLPPPPASADLAVVGSDERGVHLQWTTPAGSADPPTRFEIRHATAPFGAEDFARAEAFTELPAPGAPGSLVRATITGLAEGRTHWLGLRTRGSVGNWSGLSNVVSAASVLLPPWPVSDLRVVSRTDTSLAFAWTATGGDHGSGRPDLYRLRAAETPLDSSSFAAAPFAWETIARVDAGGAEGTTLSDVPLGRRLWFAIVAVDSLGSASALSNLVEVETTPFPPSRIGDLRGFGERGSAARLLWTAVGEDGSAGRPEAYLFRAAAAPLDDATFDGASLRWEVPARADAGALEAALLEGLPRERLWIAVKARDRVGNLSPLSNLLTLEIRDPPPAVSDLAIPFRTDTTVRLEWTTSPGANLYQLRARASIDPPLTEENFDRARHAWDIAGLAAPGARQSIDLRDLPINSSYSFALAAVDTGSGNRSALSNQVGLAYVGVPPSPIGSLRLVTRNDTTATIQWTATGDDGRIGRPRAYLVRASQERVTTANFDASELAWEVAPTVDAGEVEISTFQGFQPSRRYYVAAIAVDVVGNASLLTPNLEFTMIQTPPADIESLTARVAADTSVTLAWKATGEDGRTGRPREYLVRACADSITWRTFEECSLAWNPAARVDAGGEERIELFGLEHGRRYWFAVIAADRNGNRSRPIESVSAVPGPVAPAMVRDVRVAAESDTGLTIEWAASGEDEDRGRPARYSVRASERPIDESGFDAAELRWEILPTVDGGGIERATLTGFFPDRPHWVVVAAVDRFGNRAPISQAIAVTMTRYFPARIADLEVAAQRDTEVIVRWTASGEDGTKGRPRMYVVRVARAPIDSASFAQSDYHWEVEATTDAGGEERLALRGLEPNRRYWVAVVAVDRVDNRSALSNVVPFWLGRLASREGLALEVERRPTRAPVRLLWRTPPGVSGASIRIYDLAGRLQHESPLGAEEGGLAVWDGRDRSGHAAPPAVYFAVLGAGGSSASTRVVLVR